MLVIATAISGSGKDEALESFRKYAESRHKKVKIFKTGDMLLEHAKRINIRITPENVLNTNPTTINALRSAVLESIYSELPKLRKENYVTIVTMHAWFYWKYRYSSAFDHHYLEKFRPDIYINFLDNVESIENSLRQRKQWKSFLFGSGVSKKYGKERILDWQSAEFETTKDWSKRDRKPFFVVPSKTDPRLLYRMIYEPWRKKFYLGMPLSLFYDKKFSPARKRIDDLLKWLEKYIVVIDPRFIEPLSPQHLKVIDHATYHQVVARDLYWLIPGCTGMIAFFPEVTFSAGVNNEMREMHETNGETILIYPPDKPASPFLTSWSDGIFRSEEGFKKAFLEWLGKDYLKKVKETKD
ncbi:AAA family ATPase [Candidatus Giovannonibacteria bacterium]|nr:AAA family ATPase [Candidatus Giovannonibacteria bacterium]